MSPGVALRSSAGMTILQSQVKPAIAEPDIRAQAEVG